MWELFALIAAFCFAVAETGEKLLLTKWFSKPVTLTIVLGVTGLLAAALIFALQGFEWLGETNALIALAAGVCYVLALWIYYKAVQTEEVSRIVPLFNMTIVFVAVLAAIFLNEVLSLTQYAGVFMILAGGTLISVKSKSSFSVSRKALGLMVAATFVFSLYLILTKYLLNYSDYWTVFAYARTGGLLLIAPLLFIHWKDLKGVSRKFGVKAIAVGGLNEGINLIGVLAVTVAMSLGPATLVNALTATQAMMILVIAVALSVLKPDLLKEELSRKTIGIKAIAILLIIAGVYFAT
ncbi:MAG: DMT family transporter [Candidatus Micrarchaeota archaeon]